MPDDALGFLVSGIVLGLSAGLSPGPLMALVLRESLSRSAAAGIRVACAPLVTDPPIILIAVFILRELAALDTVLGCIALAGALFLVRLGWESMRSSPPQDAPDRAADGRSALLRGILVNILSPNPYLFWITVGAPLLIHAAGNGVAAPVAFVGAFYVCLVGSKILLAAGSARFRRFLGGAAYAWTMRLLGVSLWLMALLFAHQAIQYLVMG